MNRGHHHLEFMKFCWLGPTLASVMKQRKIKPPFLLSLLAMPHFPVLEAGILSVVKRESVIYVTAV